MATQDTCRAGMLWELVASYGGTFLTVELSDFDCQLYNFCGSTLLILWVVEGAIPLSLSMSEGSQVKRWQ